MAYFEEIGDALSLDVLRCYVVAAGSSAGDLLVAQRCKARWFALHALANAIIASTSAPGVIASLADPHNSGNGDAYPGVVVGFRAHQLGGPSPSSTSCTCTTASSSS